MRLVPCALAVAAAFGLAVSCVPNNSNDDSGAGGSSGGVKGTGGSGKGGATSSGGSTQSGGINCDDASTFQTTITDRYGSATIALTNNSNKTYQFIANWWGQPFANQTEKINGLGFTMTNPTNAVSPDNNPMGFPTIFIGSYSGRTTKGSNLPKQVSSLTRVPTIIRTNADAKGTANYNASYDVWFTQSNALVSGSNPGAGGAYLMVWLFQPSDRRPRGTVRASGLAVDGTDTGWDVWVDNTNPPCISYVANDKLSSLEFDLNNFIKHAVKNNFGITNSQYLSIIFGGFEVWGAGDGLDLKYFCANVE